MKEKLQAFGQKLWNDFRGFTPGQRAVTIAAGAALLVGGYLLLTWQPAPTYAPLYTNLAASDASAIVDKLKLGRRVLPARRRRQRDLGAPGQGRRPAPADELGRSARFRATPATPCSTRRV